MKKSIARAAARVVFPIICLWELQKFKLIYIENVLMKFRENFATAATWHYLLLLVSTEFIIILNTYGSAWRFLKFCHYKSMAIRGQNESPLSRKGSFKF